MYCICIAYVCVGDIGVIILDLFCICFASIDIMYYAYILQTCCILGL